MPCTKNPQICTGCRVSTAKIYLYHSTKIAKTRSHRAEWQTDSYVQKRWFMVYTWPYVYSFCQILHALCLFPALRLFRSLEYTC